MFQEPTFRGDLAFCSNFYPVGIEYGGEAYDSVEHAYQAFKFLDEKVRAQFQKPGLTPGVAKRKARKLKALVRSDWQEINLALMLELVRMKFSRANPKLRSMLLATGDMELVEGNWWCDNFYGACTCSYCVDKVKLNHLGKILMQVRREIRNGTSKY